MEQKIPAGEVAIDDMLRWTGHWVEVVDLKPGPSRVVRGETKESVCLIVATEFGDRQLNYQVTEKVTIRRKT